MNQLKTFKSKTSTKLQCGKLQPTIIPLDFQKISGLTHVLLLYMLQICHHLLLFHLIQLHFNYDSGIHQVFTIFKHMALLALFTFQNNFVRNLMTKLFNVSFSVTTQLRQEITNFGILVLNKLSLHAMSLFSA